MRHAMTFTGLSLCIPELKPYKRKGGENECNAKYLSLQQLRQSMFRQQIVTKNLEEVLMLENPWRFFERNYITVLFDNSDTTDPSALTL